MARQKENKLLFLLLCAMSEMVRREGRDLSARQLSIFLICYLQEGPHTVKKLADDLNISKPAISRALDTLEEATLVKRVKDPTDRRSVFVVRSAKGANFLRELREILARAGEGSENVGLMPVNAERLSPS